MQNSNQKLQFAEFNEDNSDNQSKHMNCNKTRILILLLLIVLLVIIVALPVGLLSRHNCQDNAIKTTLRPPSTTTSATTHGPTLDPSLPWNQVRLDRKVLPIHYDITFYPHFYANDSDTFNGSEIITFKVINSTKFILIHVKELLIEAEKTAVNYIGAENENIEEKLCPNSTLKIVSQWHSPRFEYWVIELKDFLIVNQYVQLRMSFSGSLRKGLVGMYKASYFDPVEKIQRHVVTSKFEPVDARKAFPCFDEPNMKAKFTIHLKHRQSFTALSNMPQEKYDLLNETDFNGQALKMTHFQKTNVLMSTYLVCIVISEFDYVEGRSNGNKLFRVYAPRHKINDTNFALEFGIKVQNYFEEYFNMSYSLPKQDMVAIPNFGSGAMEHWGLITYRDVQLLFNNQTGSASDKQGVASTVAHELAHMWFGNIVTMDWWDDLWLNEGFASFISYKACAQFLSDWKLEEQALLSGKSVMTIDANIESHPIVVPVELPAQLTEIFDSITYSKGQAVIIMIENIMGEEVFQRGIQNYMKKYQESNARTDQLWEELQKVNTISQINIAQVMDTWTKQMGYPVISIDSKTLNNYEVSQKWFLFDESTQSFAPKSPFQYKWYAKLFYKDDVRNHQSFWLNPNEVKTFNTNSTISWFYFNEGQRGYYRVNYPPQVWKNLGTVVKSNRSKFEDMEVAALIDDALRLAQAKQLNYTVALQLTKDILTEEDSYITWNVAWKALTFLNDMLKQSTIYEAWKKFVYQLSTNAYRKSVAGKWNVSGNHLTELVKPLVVNIACLSGYEDCTTNALQYYRNWKNMNGTRNDIPPGLRRIVYVIGLKFDDTEENWNFLWRQYLSTDVATERSRIGYALSTTNDVVRLLRLLSYTKNDRLILEQDFFTILGYMSEQPIGNFVLWDWFRSNWNYMKERFGISNRQFGRLIFTLTYNFGTEIKLKELQDFFSSNPEEGAGASSRKKALESVKFNIKWKQENLQQIEAYLNNLA